MARTKQTARKSLVPKSPAKKLPVFLAMRKTQPIKKARRVQNNRNGQSSDSDSEDQPQTVNNQQFSVKFDDQAEC